MKKAFTYAGLLGAIIPLSVGQLALSFAATKELSMEQIKTILKDHDQLEGLSKKWLALGHHFTKIKEERGIERAREELHGLLNCLLLEEREKMDDMDFSHTEKEAFKMHLQARLQEDHAVVDSLTNFNAFFSEKAARLLDRDINMVPFEENDEWWKSALDVVIFIIAFGTVGVEWAF